MSLERIAFINGKIITMAGQTAKSMVTRGCRIEYVGDAAQIRGARVVDLDGRVIVPGFMDAHIHAGSSQIRSMFELSLDGVEPSVDAYIKTIRDYAMENRDIRIIRGGGWIGGAFSEYYGQKLGGRFAQLGPGTDILDEALAGTPLEGRPAMLGAQGGHVLWVNSATLRVCGLWGDTGGADGEPIVRHPDTGLPWGTFKEGFLWEARACVGAESYTQAQCSAALDLFERDMHSRGVTGVMTMANVIRDPHCPEFRALRSRKNGLLYRVSPFVSEDVSAPDVIEAMGELRHGDTPFVAMDAVKIFMDGVVDGHTALLLSPYADMPDYLGMPTWSSCQALRDFVTAIDGAGEHLHVHSVGDGGTRMILDAIEAARKINGPRDARHAVAHLQLVAKDDIIRMGRMGVVASVQPYWFYKEPGYWHEVECAVLGTKRASRQYPMQSFIDAGVVVASGSDASVTPDPSPLSAIEHGVTRCALGRPGDDPLFPEEAASRYDMLMSFTANAAHQMFCTQIAGTLEPGKAANFVILERDITSSREVGDGDIHKTPISATWFMGRKVYES